MIYSANGSFLTVWADNPAQGSLETDMYYACLDSLCDQGDTADFVPSGGTETDNVDPSVTYDKLMLSVQDVTAIEKVDVADTEVSAF